MGVVKRKEREVSKTGSTEKKRAKERTNQSKVVETH